MKNKIKKKKIETIKLIFIGSKFYSKSETMISSLYLEKTWKRFDFGFVDIALHEGKRVSIRPANNKEMLVAYQMLESFKK